MMKTKIFFLAAACVAFVACHDASNSPTQPVNRTVHLTDSAKIKMVTSLGELDRDRLFVMNYTIDYMLDSVLAAKVSNVNDLKSLLAKLLWDVDKESGKNLTQKVGCSAYAASLKENGDFVMGRNYDFCHMEGTKEADATAMVLFTAPKGGKKSINFVDLYWLEYHKGFYHTDSIDLSGLMFAPYIFTDGMNEDGLAITVLHLDGMPTDQKEPGKPDIYTSVAMRAVLDKCSTVDGAIELLKGYNMHMATPANGSLHFMLADAAGKFAIVEWSFEDPLHVDSTSIPSKFVTLQADTNRYTTNFYNDPRLKDAIFGGLSNHGRDRFNTLRDTMELYHYSLTHKQARSLLQAVAQDPNPAKPTSHTQWSNVYNLTQRTVETAIVQEYGKWYEFTVTGIK